MKTLNKTKYKNLSLRNNSLIIKNTVLALLILFSSFNVFSQRYKFKKMEGSFNVDLGASILHNKNIGSLIIFKPGISYMFLNKSGRGNVDKIYGGIDLYANEYFQGGS